MANQKVLITGGSGMIGKHLTALLHKNGYSVSHLSRTKGSTSENVEVIVWNIKDQYLSASEIEGYDFIIHLAGTNIFEKAWTDEHKQAILKSRVDSANLLFNTLSQCKHKPQAIISASAVGYYGAVTTEKVFREDDEAGNDFLAKTCKQWEESINQFTKIGLKTVQLRQGMVIAKKSDALEKIELPIKFGVGASLGSGKQYMPWIHIKDVCRIYLHCLQHETLYGSYNAVAPEHLCNKEFTKKMAKALHRPLIMPHVPPFLLKLAFGEKSVMILKGSRVSPEKIKNSGFEFKYPTLEAALQEIYP